MAKMKIKTKAPAPEVIDFEVAFQAGQDDYLEIGFNAGMIPKKCCRPRKITPVRSGHVQVTPYYSKEYKYNGNNINI